MQNFESILQAVKTGEIDIQAAEEAIRKLMYHDIGHSRVDHDRLARQGASEVIFGQGKTADHIRDVMKSLISYEHNVLVTRLSSEKAVHLLNDFPEATYNEAARTLTYVQQAPELTKTTIAVVSAGTSDFSVAEEARVTAEFLGNAVFSINDAGVAGLHRLIGDIEQIRSARVIITVAGMEGALPSVVAGLVKTPVIAVPTSVGYGASFGGLAALLGMLNSCASGLSVVNIDNGFGAAYLASQINHI